MKIIITGSLGHISGPLAKNLVANSHAVTVISHNAAKQRGIDRRICYVASDERTCDEIALLLGKSVGIPALQWHVLSEQQAIQGLLANGVPANAASSLVELGKAIHQGLLRRGFDLHKPGWGKTKLENYLPEFSADYHQ